MNIWYTYLLKYARRGVVHGVPWHPQILADQLTLSQPGGGADYAHHSTTSPPPDFQTLRRACFDG